MTERTFIKGVPTRCNRCNEVHPFPKDSARAVRENSHCWRVQTMAVLDCGHMDAHWIFERDLVGTWASQHLSGPAPAEKEAT
jgi:hypothetical protein